jgi:N-acetylneuraminic acid mutarotase
MVIARIIEVKNSRMSLRITQFSPNFIEVKNLRMKTAKFLAPLCMVTLMALTPGCEQDNPLHPSNGNNHNPLVDTLPGTWTRLDNIPVGVTELPIIEKDSCIYVAGGMIDGKASSNFMCYKRKMGSWDFLPDLPVIVDHHSVAIIRDTLYILGGHCAGDLSTFNTVYGYCITTQTWSEKAPLPISLAAGAAATYKGKLYHFGGTDAFVGHTARNYYPEVLMYDPLIDQWQDVGPFLHTREHLTCLVVDDLIYLAGGRTYTGTEFITWDRVETYSPETGQWNSLTDLPVASSGLLAAGLDNELYFFGGEDLSDFKLADLHHAYSLETGNWMEVSQIPQQRHGITAVTIGREIHVLGGGPMAYSGFATSTHFVLTFD